MWQDMQEENNAEIYPNQGQKISSVQEIDYSQLSQISQAHKRKITKLQSQVDSQEYWVCEALGEHYNYHVALIYVLEATMGCNISWRLHRWGLAL